MSYLIFHNEQQLGPFEPEQILNSVKAGEFPETVFIWQEGMTDWLPANSIFPFPKNELARISPPSLPIPSAATGSIIDVTAFELVDTASRIENGFDAAFRRLVSDEQDPAAVRKILAKVKDLLTQGETVDYICVQKKPVITISPDAIVLTNRRFIAVHPKLTGFTFEDFQWKQVHDVHLSEQMLGATISCVIVGGHKFAVDSLPKKQARRVYAYAQEVEERMVETRREMSLEEKRAGAGGVTIQTAYSPPTQAQGNQDDPMFQLTKLKQMLDAGLIKVQEYESKKAEILKRM